MENRKKKANCNVRMTPKMQAALIKKAAEHNVSPAEVIRQLLAEALDTGSEQEKITFAKIKGA